jgi:hypothetical protein
MNRRKFLRSLALATALPALPAQARLRPFIIYIDAANCSTCRIFDKNGLAAFQSEAAHKGYGFKRVSVHSFQDMREQAAWPRELRSIRNQMRTPYGAPRFLVVFNGKLYQDMLGSDAAFGFLGQQ